VHTIMGAAHDKGEGADNHTHGAQASADKEPGGRGQARGGIPSWVFLGEPSGASGAEGPTPHERRSSLRSQRHQWGVVVLFCVHEKSLLAKRAATPTSV